MSDCKFYDYFYYIPGRRGCTTDGQQVEEAVLLMDNQTKRHRGFGFVTMASETAVDRICDIHFHVIKAKKVECKKALPREAVAAATAAAAAAAAAAQQPSLAYLIARQRLAAQAVAANGLMPAAFGGAGVQLASAPSPAALLQVARVKQFLNFCYYINKFKT